MTKKILFFFFTVAMTVLISLLMTDPSNYYKGEWINQNGNRVKSILKVDMNKNNKVKVTITSTNKGKSSRSELAEVKINGEVLNNKMVCNFDNDGWGHSGKATLEFKRKKIIAHISVIKKESDDSHWGIQKGKIIFVKK